MYKMIVSFEASVTLKRLVAILQGAHDFAAVAGAFEVDEWREGFATVTFEREAADDAPFLLERIPNYLLDPAPDVALKTAAGAQLVAELADAPNIGQIAKLTEALKSGQYSISYVENLVAAANEEAAATLRKAA